MFDSQFRNELFFAEWIHSSEDAVEISISQVFLVLIQDSKLSHKCFQCESSLLAIELSVNRLEDGGLKLVFEGFCPVLLAQTP